MRQKTDELSPLVVPDNHTTTVSRLQCRQRKWGKEENHYVEGTESLGKPKLFRCIGPVLERRKVQRERELETFGTSLFHIQEGTDWYLCVRKVGEESTKMVKPNSACHSHMAKNTAFVYLIKWMLCRSI